MIPERVVDVEQVIVDRVVESGVIAEGKRGRDEMKTASGTGFSDARSTLRLALAMICGLLRRSCRGESL